MAHLTSDAASWLSEPDEAPIEALNQDKRVAHTQAQRNKLDAHCLAFIQLAAAVLWWRNCCRPLVISECPAAAYALPTW